jgi:hypothetical protein
MKMIIMIMTVLDTGNQIADVMREMTFLPPTTKSLHVETSLQCGSFMKILLYLVQFLPQMESHSLPLMLNILLTAERRRNAKEIETGIWVVVVAIGTETETETETGTGTGTGIGIGIVVIVPERQMTITTRNHGGESMNETTTSIEDMISIPNLDGMKMSIVLGIVMSAIGIGNPDQTEPETGNPDRTETGIGTGTGTGTEETGTEEVKTEETEETGRGETETETKETGKGNEETGTERKTERNLINHIPRLLMKARHHRRQQVVTLLDPSSKKCLLLTLTVVVFYLNIQKQTQELDLVHHD